MSIARRATQYGTRRLSRRLSRSLPFIGSAIALATFVGSVRRKGLFGGAVDTALNAIPFVGGVKTLAEIVRDRDFIKDRI